MLSRLTRPGRWSTPAMGRESMAPRTKVSSEEAMSKRSSYVLAAACIVLGVFIWYRWFRMPDLDAPDQLILYSIDGRDFDPPESRPMADETFHGYPVLGKVEIIDPDKRKELMTAVKEGIARGDR